MSDTVKVSQRMQSLILDALDQSYAFEVAATTYDRDVARTAFKQAEDALLREIATLEAAASTNPSNVSISSVVPPQTPAVTHSGPCTEVSPCAGCQLDRLRQSYANGPQARELPCTKCGGQAACWCDRPQTLGEEIPANVAEQIQRANEVRAARMNHRVLGGKDHAIWWLAKDRSRLLTALEASATVRENAVYKRAADSARRENEMRAKAQHLQFRVDELESASVLQKEELRTIKIAAIKLVAESNPVNGYERWNTAKELLYNAIDAAVIQSPTSGA